TCYRAICEVSTKYFRKGLSSERAITPYLAPPRRHHQRRAGTASLPKQTHTHIPELTDRKKSRKLESKGAHVMEQKKMKNRTAPPRYDDAFKAGAVRLVTEQGRQPVEVAKELGICIDTLRSWLKASGVQMGQVSRQNREQKRIRELEAENRSLRRQLGEKDEVIDVLKKSVGILSKPERRNTAASRRSSVRGPLWNRHAGYWRYPAAGIT